jgi:hypothetical protein
MNVSSPHIIMTNFEESDVSVEIIAVAEGCVTLKVGGSSVKLSRDEFGWFLHACIQVDYFLDDGADETEH